MMRNGLTAPRSTALRHLSIRYNCHRKKLFHNLLSGIVRARFQPCRKCSPHRGLFCLGILSSVSRVHRLRLTTPAERPHFLRHRESPLGEEPTPRYSGGTAIRAARVSKRTLSLRLLTAL